MRRLFTACSLIGAIILATAPVTPVLAQNSLGTNSSIDITGGVKNFGIEITNTIDLGPGGLGTDNGAGSAVGST